jgi:hypothetical protein
MEKRAECGKDARVLAGRGTERGETMMRSTAGLTAFLIFSAGVVVASPSLGAVPSAEAPPPTSYALPLALSYLAMPAMTVGAAVAFPDANEGQGAALVAGVIVLGLAAPVAVHLAHGQSVRALVSPFGMLGSTALFALAGLGVGALVADAQCGPSSPSSEANGCRLSPVLLATYTGAAVGYVGWAIYDTVEHSLSEGQSRPAIAIAPKILRASLGLDVIGAF